MAEIETLGILQDVESLVSDQLQVVSYKWLSRNYLLPSNTAKSLLQEFVEKHGKELAVVYALSGWLKSSPPSYHIRLVTGPKLGEAKEEFDGSCSVQVYSVQSCIPKDPAVLWNAEFVQAEELFKQPSAVDNCLRDNRFCGITNSYIKRTVEGSLVSVSTPQIQTGLSLGPSKCSFSGKKTSVPEPLQQKVEQTSLKVVKDIKNESKSTGIQDEPNKPSINKEKPKPPFPASKTKVQNGKSSSGAEGSLANLWNRASAKPKASSAVEAAAGNSAEAQICAREAEDVEGISSDDDGQGMNFKRSSNKEGTRKRRVVLDFSDDDDEYGDAVNLSSPERGKLGQSMEESIASLIPKKSDSKADNKPVEDKSKVTEKVAEDKECDQSTKQYSSAVTNDKPKEISTKDRAQSTVSENGMGKKDKLTETPDSPKRRKVMKTRIDERGREVTEVVWEGEETEAKKPNTGAAEKADNGATKKANNAATKKAENSTASKDNNRDPVIKKSPTIGASNPTGKAGNKKTANKDPKQGNILSFFKKA